MSPEEHIDSLTINHIRDLLKSQDAVNDSILDVQISSIRAQAVQLVQKPHGHHDGFLHDSDAAHDSLEEKVAVLDLQIFDFGLKAQAHKEEKHPQQSFAFSTNHTTLSLDLHDAHSPVNRWGVHTVVEASLSEVTSALIHRRADLAWRALSVALEMDAADYIYETISAHTDPIIRAVNTYRRLQSRLLSATRDCIYQALQRSKNLSVFDPLSTIQPSYLIQTGRPHEIRVHAASKILRYIRSCLRSLTVEEREAIGCLSSVEDTVVKREEVLDLLEGLAADTDAAGVANLKLITRLFGAPNSPKVTRPQPTIQTARIKLQAVKVAVLHPKHGPPSEFSLDTVEIIAALKKSGLFMGSSKSPKDPLSVRDKQRSVVQHLALSIALDGSEVLILPHILNFAQNLVRLHKRFKNTTPISSSISPPHLAQGPLKTTFLVDATLSLQSLRFQVAAEKLIVAFIISRLGLVSSVYARPHPTSQGRPDLSANGSLFFDSVALQARSSMDKDSPAPQDTLAEILLKKTGLNCALRHEVASNPTIRAALVVGCLQLSVPRSAIRLSRFIEEWKADYLPSFEQTVQALVSELRQEPTAPSSPTSMRDLVPTTHLQLSIGTFGVFLHVLPGTWLSWELLDTVAHLKLGVGLALSRHSSAPFGLRFSSQRISIATLSKGETLEDTSEKGGLKLDLPPMTVTGTYVNRGVHILVSAGFFSFIVKPSYWDTLLSVQQKFGNDINDLFHVLADAQTKRPSTQGPAKSQPSSSQSLLQSGAFKAKGFRIGLEGHSSTLFLECEDISGSLTDGESKGKGKFWQLNATGLALSLAPRFYAVLKSESGRFDGNRRSAFVQIDCKAEVDRRTAQRFLRIKASKIHAIMQPSSIGEIGDFIDHLQACRFYTH
jgi:protein CSF1